MTRHPATKAVVDACAEWYDRHFDPLWRDRLLCVPDEDGRHTARLFQIPRTSADLRSMSEVIKSLAFATGGNLTHPPSYGALVALMMLDHAKTLAAPRDRVHAAEAYRDAVSRDGRFVTYTTGMPVPSDRFRSADQSLAVRLVKQRDDGVIVHGMAGLHTMVPYVDEVCVTAGRGSRELNHRVCFAVPVATPGVRVVCRRPAARFSGAPLSARYDELDAQLWLDNVFVPWERVFALRFDLPARLTDRRQLDMCWLLWHQLLGGLARAEFTLALGLAVASVMGLRGRPRVADDLAELILNVQTVQTSVLAAEYDPEITAGGHLAPRGLHLAPGALHLFRQRQRMAEIVRTLAGQAGVMHPGPTDFDDPCLTDDLERAFGGGGLSARQRAALMELVWDHVSSELSSREAAFELAGTGGLVAWRARLMAWFDRYDDLADEVLRMTSVPIQAIGWQDSESGVPQ